MYCSRSQVPREPLLTHGPIRTTIGSRSGIEGSRVCPKGGTTIHPGRRYVVRKIRPGSVAIADWDGGASHATVYRAMRTSRSLFFLAALFVFAGVMHFVIPKGYLGIMPPWVPLPLEAVYLSGLLEIAGGMALLIPSVRRAAGAGLILLLIAVFPANVQMLINAVDAGASHQYVAILLLRLPLQPLLIVWVYRAAVDTA